MSVRIALGLNDNNSLFVDDVSLMQLMMCSTLRHDAQGAQHLVHSLPFHPLTPLPSPRCKASISRYKRYERHHKRYLCCNVTQISTVQLNS